MKAKSAPGQRVSRRVHLVTPLPAELTIERLQELQQVEAPGLEKEYSYEISHEGLGDTIYFEVRTLVKHGFDSQKQKLIVTGAIREIDATRTEVKGEFQRIGFSPYLPTGLQRLFVGFAPWYVYAAINGHWSALLFTFFLFAALSLAAPVLVNYRALDRAPTLERIEQSIQPRAEDRKLIALRQEEHRLHLTQAAGALRFDDGVGRETSAQERG